MTRDDDLDDLIDRTRIRRGLPAHVEDPEVLRFIASVVVDARRRTNEAAAEIRTPAAAKPGGQRHDAPTA